MPDWDDVFSYSTSKVVKVRHKWLGIIQKSMMLMVIFYIGAVLVYLKKGYLATGAPVGKVTKFLHVDPSNTLPITSLPYCKQNPEATTDLKLPCVSWDPWDTRLVIASRRLPYASSCPSSPAALATDDDGVAQRSSRAIHHDCHAH